MIRMDGEYPTEEYLEYIENYDTIEGSGFDLLMDVLDNWWMDYGVKVQRKYRGEIKVFLSTGGWSGNESMIYALRANKLFWMRYYYSHRVGGHYVFIFHE